MNILLESRILPYQALGIPFALMAAAEKNPLYQKVISANQGSKLKHLYDSLGSMVGRGPCVRHPNCHECLPRKLEVSLGVTGSPCNPYSTQRCKRFSDGGVASHSMDSTTMTSVIQFYVTWEPHAAVTEQVRGFGMRTSAQDPEPPLNKRLS